MKAKKLLAVFLCVLCAVSCFTACGGDDKGGDATQAPTTGNANEETYFIPESGFGGAEFTVLTNTDDAEWTCNDFFMEEDSDENPVASAIYQRQKKIEETFGVKMKVVAGQTRGSINDLVTTAEKSGLMDYDLVVNSVNHMFTLAQGDFLVNLDDVTHLDLSSEAWDQSTLKQTSIGGNNYFATGDITTIDNDATWVMMFNKKIADSVGIGVGDLPSIYDLVKEDKWTIDKFIEYANLFVYQDLDQSGTITHLDSFPLATSDDIIMGLYYGANNRIIQKDDADIPYLPQLSTKTISLVEKIVGIYTPANQITFDFHHYLDVDPLGYPLAQRMFEEDRALFYSEVMQCVTRLRAMNTDFGIIPMPKADENQKHYTTHSVNIVTHFAAFPKQLSYNEERLARSGMIAQALAVEGMNILTPAYYEKSLVGQGTRDEESADMLPIIFANRVMDIGYITSDEKISAMRNNIKNAVEDSDAGGLASLFARSKTKVNAALEDLVEQFSAVE